jgi:hypothetical protein
MKQKSETTLDDVFEDNKKDIFANLNCHRIGTIQGFDATNQTAKIKLVDKRVIETEEGEELKDYSLLLDCPVFIPKGANGGFTYPIIIGDTCLVLFNDRDIDNWFESGNIQKPNTNRMHNLSDGIAIVGIKNKQNALSDFDNSKTTMNYQETKIELDDKAKIENATRNLKTLIDDLINELKALTVVDNRITPTITLITSQTTFDNLETIKTQFGELLK